jgi:rhamnosyl/mannosyltransferase
MHFGKPVVATRIPGSAVDWVNQDRVTGLNVPCRDASALAEAIARICQEPEMYRHMSRNGRHRVSNDFTLETMGSKVQELYRKVLNGAPPARSDEAVHSIAHRN